MSYLGVAALLAVLFVTHCDAQELGYNREALKSLTEYRQQHRKTIDGRLCAAAFVQDNQTYTDCTTAKSPDGSTGREWCYVEVQLLGKGYRDWDYCQGVVDYDAVLAGARNLFEAKASALQVAANAIAYQSQRMNVTVQRYHTTCVSGSEDVIAQRLHESQELIRGSEHTLAELDAATSVLNGQQRELMLLKEEINRDAIASLKSRHNCEATRGYEVEPVADGLRGSYYPNSTFEGPPVGYLDDVVVNFVWDAASPVAEVPFQHFSVRWEGYVKAPRTGQYRFITHADCGVRVFLEDSAIIVDRMPTPSESSAIAQESVKVLSPLEKTGVVKTVSAAQELKGGNKYKLRVEYFHLSSHKYRDPDLAKIVLSWSSPTIDEQVVPAEYLFKGRPGPGLKISGLIGEHYDLTQLENGVLAFTNSKHHFIADVPGKFEGLKLLRTKAHPPTNLMNLELSNDCHIFVAMPHGANIPVHNSSASHQPVAFEKTDDSISVYRAQNNQAKSDFQTSFDIYSARVLAGKASFVTSAETSFFIFFQPLKSGSNICEGDREVVSLTDSKYYASCTASSYESSQHDCQSGLSGKNFDLPFGSWHTSTGNGVGQYIMVTFKKPVEIQAFQFKTLSDPEAWPTEIMIELPGAKGGEKFVIQPGDHTYQLNYPKIARGAKATITGMSHTGDSGGSISLIGTPCLSAAEVAQEEHLSPSVKIDFRGGSAGLVKKGFKVDDGSPKAMHGYVAYGWAHRAPPVSVHSCGAVTRGDSKDTSYGGVSFAEPECTVDTKCELDVDCEYPNSWSIDMPRFGTYLVTVEIGSPCSGEQWSNVSINGVRFIENQLLSAGEYVKAAGEVSLGVTTTMTLTSTTRTTLQSIEIELVHGIV